jgi:predicted MFS family arabinose efflux permease
MPGRRWIILAILFAARAATGFQFQSVGSAANLLMRDLGLDYAEIGILLGAYLLPGVVVSFPAGLLGQRCDERKLGLAGLALMVISNIALSFCNGFAMALAARMVGGVGATVVILVATKMTTDWFDSREIVLAMSILQVSWPFGAMLALPIQATIAQSLGWPAVMGSAAAFSALALFAFLLVSQPDQERLAQPAATGHTGLPAEVLLAVIIAGAIWGAMNLTCILFFTYAPLSMVAQGSSPTAAASLTSLAIWFTILAIPSGGYLVHRLGAPIAAILSCALVAAVALALSAAGVHPAISCLVFGVAVGPMSGAILSLPSRVLASHQRAVGLGVFYTCFYVLMAVGPFAAGRLQDIWGTPSAALIAGAVLLAAIAPLLLIFVALTSPQRLAEIHRDAELRAVS